MVNTVTFSGVDLLLVTVRVALAEADAATNAQRTGTERTPSDLTLLFLQLQPERRHLTSHCSCCASGAAGIGETGSDKGNDLLAPHLN